MDPHAYHMALALALVPDSLPDGACPYVHPCVPMCTGIRLPVYRKASPMAAWVYPHVYVPRCVPQCVSTRVFPGGFPGVHPQAKENSGGRNEKNERESGVKRKKVRIYYVYTKRKEGPDKRRARGAPACVARTYVLAPQRETNLGPCHPAGPVPIAGSDQAGVGNRALSPGGLGWASRRGGGLAPRSHRRQTARRGVGNLGAPVVSGIGVIGGTRGTCVRTYVCVCGYVRPYMRVYAYTHLHMYAHITCHTHLHAYM